MKHSNFRKSFEDSLCLRQGDYYLQYSSISYICNIFKIYYDWLILKKVKDQARKINLKNVDLLNLEWLINFIIIIVVTNF